VPVPYWYDPVELEVLEENPEDEYEGYLKDNNIAYRCEAGVTVVLKWALFASCLNWLVLKYFYLLFEGVYLFM
jgi:hypothetical protein